MPRKILVMLMLEISWGCFRSCSGGSSTWETALIYVWLRFLSVIHDDHECVPCFFANLHSQSMRNRINCNLRSHLGGEVVHLKPWLIWRMIADYWHYTNKNFGYLLMDCGSLTQTLVHLDGNKFIAYEMQKDSIHARKFCWKIMYLSFLYPESRRLAQLELWTGWRAHLPILALSHNWPMEMLAIHLTAKD